jgi:hypothetical protein
MKIARYGYFCSSVSAARLSEYLKKAGVSSLRELLGAAHGKTVLTHVQQLLSVHKVTERIKNICRIGAVDNLFPSLVE